MSDPQDDSSTDLSNEGYPGDTIPVSAESPLLGTMLDDRYLLLSSLGEGGMGHVYQATHVLMDKPVAIKLIHAELAHMENVVKRFEREARSSSRLSDPHCITVTDFGKTAEGTLFLVMELLDGESLDVRIKKGALMLHESIRITKQMLKGLSHAHEQGVIHRDLKPENVQLANFGEEKDFVKILDFGIAKLAHGDGSDESLTKSGVVFGTPKYLSPEQALGEDVDHRADLYAVGVIMFEMLTGRPPFHGKTVMDTMSAHLTAPIPHLSAYGSFPRGLQEVVNKALAKKTTDRFASADKFLDALEQIDLSADPGSSTQRLLERITKPQDSSAQKKKRITVIASIAIVAMAALSAYILLPDTKPPKEVSAAEKMGDLGEKTLDIKTLLEKADAQIVAGDAAEAVVTARKALVIEPDFAPSELLLAHAQFLSGDRLESMELYTKALKTDTTLSQNVRFKENLKEALKWKNIRAKAAFLLAKYGNDDSIEFLAGLANSALTEGDVRRTVRSALVESGHEDTINWLDSLTADWHEQKRCKQRKEIIAAMEKTGDPRFLPLLEKFRPVTTTVKVGKKKKRKKRKKKKITTNSCIGADVLHAIATLQPLGKDNGDK